MKQVRYHGRKHSYRELAEKYANEYGAGVSKQLVINRLRNGWSAEKALHQPVMKRHKFEYQGKSYTAIGLAEELQDKAADGLLPEDVANRLIKGWDLDKALKQSPRNRSEIRRYQYRGKSYTLNELAQYAHHHYRRTISPSVLYRRLELGWSPEKAMRTPTGSHQPLTAERARKSHNRATQKYAQKNAKKIRAKQNFYYARSYVRKYSSLEDLADLKDAIQHKEAHRHAELGVNPDPDWLNEAEREKRKRGRYRVNAYLRQPKDQSTLDKLKAAVQQRQTELAADANKH